MLFGTAKLTDQANKSRRERRDFKKAMDAPGMVDAATDSPNAPERGGKKDEEEEERRKVGVKIGWSVARVVAVRSRPRTAYLDSAKRET